MKLFGGYMAYMAASASALDPAEWLKIKFQSTQLQGVNQQVLGGALSADQQKEVMLNLNENSPQMGYNPLQMLMSGGATGLNKQDIIGNVKNNMMNQVYNQFQSAPINPLLLQYAKNGGTNQMGNPLTKDQILLGNMADPMGTILRLKRSSNAAVKARGNTLLKKMVARQTLTDDPYLHDLFVDNDKSKIKDYLFAKQLDSADPFMKTLLYRKFNSGAAAGATTSNKDLIKTQLVANQFGDQINQVRPNDAYLMFKFLEKAAKGNNGRVPANIILDVALGNDVAGIKSDDFQEKFGVSATEYVCAAHEEAVRVPCMVNQEIVTPSECASIGCCYNTLSADGATNYQHTGAVPICYHNLLGKIGSGIARHMINDDNIKSLFGGEMPLLSDLQEAQTWAESQMPDVLRRLVKDEGSFYGMPSGNTDWWDNMYDSADGKFSIYATPAPPRAKKEWTPHGPTAMPHAGKLQIPEIGGFLDGDDARVKDLDFIVGNHVNKIRATLNSESYTCRLIPPENMVNCFDNNYDALSTELTTGETPEAACGKMGCCFREVNLFEKGNVPVCYRSLRSGFCDLPVNMRGDPTLAGEDRRRDTWWNGNPYREECGSPGIARGECLLNPQCCFDTNPRQEGEPHCYKRGGVESLFNSRTGAMGNQCDLTAVQLRENCFDNNSKFGRLLNRVATEDQCVAAGCCFSQAAADAAKSMGVLGTMNLAGPHCFKRPTDLNNEGGLADNYAQLGTVSIGQLKKVCVNDPLWPKINQREWVKNAVSGRYELTNTAVERPLSREPCTKNGAPITDRHTCVYVQGCCFEKSSNPINPWCYKARLVKKP